MAEAGFDAGALGPDAVGRLAWVMGSSPAVSIWFTQDPSLTAAIEEDLFVERGRDEYADRFASPAETREDQALFFQRLRKTGKRELARIVAREALDLAPVEATAREISSLAEAAVDTAFRWAWTELADSYGDPVDETGQANHACALGMGKLGGRELNLSSDVDLIFLYRSPRGATSGGTRGHIEPHAFFCKLVSLVAEAIGRVTEDGVVFRVDLDLRPEGRSGELAQPLDSAALYYQSWGQTWERAAMMKARPVAGDLALGEAFCREMEPFTFRRALDYTTVEDIKEMKRRIDQSAARRLAGDDDLKIGRGGIREAEFFVQTLQLIHGGKIPEVREPNTLRALDRLCEKRIIEPEVASGLSRCYRLLRRLEHAIQALHFRQTHRLPASLEEKIAVARRLGFGSGGGDPVSELTGALDDARAEVHEAYGRLVHGASRTWENENPRAEEARELLRLESGGPRAEEILTNAGFRNPAGALEGLRLLREGPPNVRPSERARRTLDRIAPFLLGEVSRSPDPDRALLHFGEFLANSGARASYLSLLDENPQTAKLLIALFGTSDFLSRYLVNHPELLDELVVGSQTVREKSRDQMAQDLRVASDRCRDEEERLETVRRFRNSEFIRIALNDLWGSLEAEEVSRQITRVAEVCVGEAHRQAFARLEAKYGEPLEAESGRPARFAILGLGKLGGSEIDYHSDLDVLFLYSGPGSSRASENGRTLSNGEFFARVGQRIIGALSTRTREGIAFRMDARLRPSGQAGPLVTSLDSFESYHRAGAQTWERQALVKLRAVAGDPELGSAVEEMVRRILYSGPAETDPRPEIRRMRGRIEHEVAREADGREDLKTGCGGLLDVEFAVQALQLVHGWKGSDLQSPNTLESLDALIRRGLLEESDGAALREGYHFLRRVEARLRVLQERPTDALPRERSKLDELARGLGYPAGEAGEALVEDVRESRARIRRAYERAFRGERP